MTRDGTFHVATIISVRTGWQYGCDLIKNSCVRFPLTGGPIRRVIARRVNTKNLRPTAEQVEGFAVFEYTTPDGAKWLQAPALNFANLVEEDPRNGMHRTMHHIRLREPAPELFEPPAGAVIKDAAAAKYH